MDPSAFTVAAYSLKLFFGGMFIAAGIHKLANPVETASIVADYELLPGALVRPAAWALPALEIVVAVLIFIPALAATGLLLAAGVLGLYAMALLSVLLRDIELRDCGCGGPLQGDGIDAFPVWRNVVLIALAVFLFLGERGLAAPTLSAWAIIVPAAVFTLFVYWTLDGLWANHRKLKLIKAHYG